MDSPLTKKNFIQDVWGFDEKNIKEISRDPIWRNWVASHKPGYGMPENPQLAVYWVFGVRLPYIFKTWTESSDVFSELMMNMGGGIPYEVLQMVKTKIHNSVSLRKVPGD